MDIRRAVRGTWTSVYAIGWLFAVLISFVLIASLIASLIAVAVLIAVMFL